MSLNPQRTCSAVTVGPRPAPPRASKRWTVSYTSIEDVARRRNQPTDCRSPVPGIVTKLLCTIVRPVCREGGIPLFEGPEWPMDRSGEDNKGPASQRTRNGSARDSLGRQTIDTGGQEEEYGIFRKLSTLTFCSQPVGLALRFHNTRRRILSSNGHRLIRGQCSGGPQERRVALSSCMSNLSTKRTSPCRRWGTAARSEAFSLLKGGANGHVSMVQSVLRRRLPMSASRQGTRDQAFDRS